jgi:dephospho-CoA kinase
MIVIGVTGSIGTGKSTIISMLKDMGVPVHDADHAVATMLAPRGIAVKTVGKTFPEAFDVDAEGYAFINKEELGKIVFHDRDKKEQLENILHPLVKIDSDNFVNEMKVCGHNIVALEIPLLFETGREEDMDFTICVSCSPEQQKNRVMQRKGMTSEKFDAIVAGQMTDREKTERADFVIMNDGNREDTREQLANIIERIKSRVSKISGVMR